ncbi:unnamed protein product [Ilex paraguariensis]|uniref:Uncharacterized protein n=1 Tax=Ilex paraguariensis TaxID=185542 RepID=A0ABC8SUH2_9AQUA
MAGMRSEDDWKVIGRQPGGSQKVVKGWMEVTGGWLESRQRMKYAGGRQRMAGMRSEDDWKVIGRQPGGNQKVVKGWMEVTGGWLESRQRMVRQQIKRLPKDG